MLKAKGPRTHRYLSGGADKRTAVVLLCLMALKALPPCYRTIRVLQAKARFIRVLGMLSVCHFVILGVPNALM